MFKERRKFKRFNIALEIGYTYSDDDCCIYAKSAKHRYEPHCIEADRHTLLPKQNAAMHAFNGISSCFLWCKNNCLLLRLLISENNLRIIENN